MRPFDKYQLFYKVGYQYEHILNNSNNVSQKILKLNLQVIVLKIDKMVTFSMTDQAMF